MDVCRELHTCSACAWNCWTRVSSGSHLTLQQIHIPQASLDLCCWCLESQSFDQIWGLTFNHSLLPFLLPSFPPSHLPPFSPTSLSPPLPTCLPLWNPNNLEQYLDFSLQINEEWFWFFPLCFYAVSTSFILSVWLLVFFKPSRTQNVCVMRLHSNHCNHLYRQFLMKWNKFWYSS